MQGGFAATGPAVGSADPNPNPNPDPDPDPNSNPNPNPNPNPNQVGSAERTSNTSCGSQSPVPSPVWPCAAAGAAVPGGGAWGLAPAACGAPPSRGGAYL